MLQEACCRHISGASLLQVGVAYKQIRLQGSFVANLHGAGQPRACVDRIKNPERYCYRQAHPEKKTIKHDIGQDSDGNSLQYPDYCWVRARG